VLTPGEAVAAMMLKGLGFANRPLSLTPQLCAHTPLALLLREGIEAERCNRCQRGRTLDDAAAYGGDLVWEALALALCAHAGMERRFHPLDTTSVSRTGADVPDRDEPALHLTHGSSTDHRPALKQAVWARMVSHDGGLPLVRKSWDGHTADTQGCQARAEALRRAFQDTPRPRSLVAEATLSCEDQATPLAQRGFLPRLPATLTVVSQLMSQALPWDPWQPCAHTTRSQPLTRCPSGMAQRWLGG
jgi:hypothetical protein